VRTSNTTCSMARRVARSLRGAHRAAGGQRSRTYEKLRQRAARKAIASRKNREKNWNSLAIEPLQPLAIEPTGNGELVTDWIKLAALSLLISTVLTAISAAAAFAVWWGFIR
jgi:hypothetical protein